MNLGQSDAYSWDFDSELSSAETEGLFGSQPQHGYQWQCVDQTFEIIQVVVLLLWGWVGESNGRSTTELSPEEDVESGKDGIKLSEG